MPEELLQLAGGREGEPPADPLKYYEAIASFRAREPISDAAFRALEERNHNNSFIIAHLTKLDLVNDIWKSLDKALQEGSTFEEWKKEIGPRLEEEWGRKNPSRLETIFRTNLQHSYGAGIVMMSRNPAVAKRRPYWKFSAIEDSRTTEICQHCDGTVLPVDHPFWATHQPPLHYNCRSRLISLTRSQAEAMGVTAIPTSARPQTTFGNVERDFKPDLTRFPPELAHAYQQQVNKQG